LYPTYSYSLLLIPPNKDFEAIRADESRLCRHRRCNWKMESSRLRLSSIDSFTTLTPRLTEKLWPNPGQPPLNPHIISSAPPLVKWMIPKYLPALLHSCASHPQCAASHFDVSWITSSCTLVLWRNVPLGVYADWPGPRDTML